MSGILLAEAYPGYYHIAIGFCLLGVGLVGYGYTQNKSSSYLPIGFFISLGYLALHPWLPLQYPPQHVAHFKDGSYHHITGTIKSIRHYSEDRSKLFLKVERLTLNANDTPVNGNISVTVRGKGAELKIGQRVYFKSKIRSFRNFNNPGGFDYKRYMTFKGLCGAAYVQVSEVTILNPSFDSIRRYPLKTLRDDIGRCMDRLAPSQAAGILKALIVGKRDLLTTQTQDQFQRVGIGHILAISGLHIGLVAGVAYGLGVRMFSWIPLFLWNAWTRKGAALAALAPIILYGYLAGMSPSTQRAVIMATVFMMSFWIDREHDPLNTLAVAAILILIIDPPSLFSASFQLSFTAVIAILFVYTRPEIRPATIPTKRTYITDRMIDLIKMSLAAYIGILPLSMFYFGQLSLVGPLVNLLAVPALGLLILPLGLISAFIYPISVEIAELGFQVAIWGVNLLLIMIEWIAAFPYASIKTVTPSALEIVFYYVFISSVWVLNRSNDVPTMSSASKNNWSIQHSFFVVGSLAVAYMSISTMVDVIESQRLQPLKISVIDVKQGSAALVQLPNGECLLVDGGGFSNYESFDMGRMVIAPLLRYKKIRRINTLVLTHPQADHLNGLLYIAEHYGVKQIWSNGQSAKSKGYQRLLSILKEKDISSPEFSSIKRQFSIAGVDFHIIYPPIDFLKRSKVERWRDTNNNSLVLQIEFGNVSFLFPGDIHAEAEHELIDLFGNTLKSTVLLAPHHGSRTSSSESFLRSVRPKVVVISSGYGRKGFPHPSVIKRYQELGCAVYRTNQHGAVEFTTHGKNLQIRSTIPSSPTGIEITKSGPSINRGRTKQNKPL